MRSRSHRSRVCLGDRPFQGPLGASLYVGTPDAINIRYRRNKSVGRIPWFPLSASLIDIGADSIPRTLRVAHSTSPTDELSYVLPANLIGVQVACQVRTFANDYENETIYRPQIIGSDDDGNETNSILGTVIIIDLEKRDGGGLLVTFAYTASPYGVQPATFVLVKTAGPGTVANVEIPSTDRIQSIEVDGLANGQSYTFDLQARSGLLSAVLTTVTFTADAAGPVDPTSVVVVPY